MPLLFFLKTLDNPYPYVYNRIYGYPLWYKERRNYVKKLMGKLEQLLELGGIKKTSYCLLFLELP